jgi:hypothetical protein
MALVAFDCCSYLSNRGFTPWMDDATFHQWRAQNLDHHPIYLSAVEGRLYEGQKIWRVRVSAKPEHVKWSWKWFSQLDDKSYQYALHDNVDEKGYHTIWSQDFVDGNGERLHQVIFLHIASAQ